MIDTSDIDRWLARYRDASLSDDPADIAALFTDQCPSRPRITNAQAAPYNEIEHARGRGLAVSADHAVATLRRRAARG
jgi:hypothetical protein